MLLWFALAGMGLVTEHRAPCWVSFESLIRIALHRMWSMFGYSFSLFMYPKWLWAFSHVNKGFPSYSDSEQEEILYSVAPMSIEYAYDKPTL